MQNFKKLEMLQTYRKAAGQEQLGHWQTVIEALRS